MGRSLLATQRARRLGFERLEAREVMTASLTAALNGGVLSVVDTKTSDTIVLHQQAGRVSIDGFQTTFLATQLKSISIDTGAGNDTVRLDTQNFAGGHALRIAVTVHSAGGNDRVIGLNGVEVFFNGIHNLNYDGRGGARLDGAALDWFDTHTQDAAIRSLAKAEFRDGVLDRGDAINLLRQVERAGALTAVELSDLRLIAGNGALFGSLTYVQVLTSDIVNGNVANAHYQSHTLGNLAVGSGAGQLELLVQKWFYGTDHPLGQSAWGPTYAYRQASGTLFGSGVAYTDVAQGGLGDCYLLAGLGEVALKNPSAITSMFIVNGDGTYTVRYYNNGRADYVTVDSKLPTDANGRFVFANNGGTASNSTNKLWVALAEKAYAQINKGGWLRTNGLPGGGKNSYIAVQGGWIADSLKQITGHAVQAFNPTAGANSFSTFIAAFHAGNMIGFASNGNPTLSTVVGGHAYALVAYNATAKTVTLFNPWRVNSPSSKPGLITLTWTQIQANFSYFDRAV